MTVHTDSALERWDDVLRAYAATLDDFRTFLSLAGPEGLDGDAEVPPGFVTPLDMPPLPAELLGRAEALQRESAGLAELARDLLRRFPPVAPSRRAPSDASSSPTLMDTRL